MRQEVVTVFGGSGFLGGYVVRALAREGAAIKIISRDPHTAMHVKPAGPVGQITLLSGNINDEYSVKQAVHDSTIVINCIGIMAESVTEKFANIHAQGAERIAKAAREAGVRRLVHISALGVDKASKSTYARSKLHGEKAVLAAFPEATILRPSLLFGTEDDFFNRFARLASWAPVMPLIGGGHNRFQPVYVADVALAVMTALADPDTKGRIFELGGPKIYSFRELLEYIMEVTGQKRCLLSVPYALAALPASLLQLLPKPLLTLDQLELLKVDNVVSNKALGFGELNINPQALESVVPVYLERFRG